MSEELGPLTFGKKEEQIFLGREIAQHRDYSEATAIEIDREVKEFVLKGYNTAQSIMKEREDVLTRIAEALLEREVLDVEQINALAEGRSLPEPRSAAPESAPLPSVETIEDSADESSKDPGVLPQPGDQPA